MEADEYVHVDMPDVTRQDAQEEESLFWTNLVALFTCRLDDVDAIGQGLNTTWKVKAIKLCVEGREESAAFLRPWFQNDVKLAAQPLLKWFQDRRKDAVELRRRANGIRQLLERSVGTGIYDSRVRTALKRTCRDLEISWSKDITDFENVLAKQIAAGSISATSITGKTQDHWTASRIAKVTAAGAIGGAIIALTAGALTPIVAPLVGGIFALNAAASAALSVTLFGVAGAGLTGYKMADRTKRGLMEFFFEKVTRNEPDEDNPSLHVIIAVNGTLDNESLEPLHSFWSRAFEYETETSQHFGLSDIFMLVYDRKALIEYSRTVRDLLKDQVASYAYSYFLTNILGHALMAAVSLPMTVANAFNVINNSFVKCERRAADAGIELAEALRRNSQGARPVTLVGYGFGALTIFRCLEELARERALGIVENVILAGCPLRASEIQWAEIRRVASGEIYNCYCEQDWTLKLAMQWSNSDAIICGVDPVRQENIRDVKIGAGHYEIGADGGIMIQLLLRSLLGEE